MRVVVIDVPVFVDVCFVEPEAQWRLPARIDDHLPLGRKRAKYAHTFFKRHDSAIEGTCLDSGGVALGRDRGSCHDGGTCETEK